jgi:hypothetical protein
MENIPLVRPIGGQQWREEDDPARWVVDGERRHARRQGGVILRGHKGIFSIADLLLVATRGYSPLLTSYWSQQGDILHC